MQNFQEIPSTNLDSFLFVITFITLYFILFLSLYFAEVGLDEINLWRILANFAVVAIFLTILIMFFQSFIFQAIPFFIFLLTITIFFFHNWRLGKEDILYQIGLVISFLLSFFWMILIIAFEIGTFEGFQGGEFIGLSPTLEGPTYNRLIQTIFAIRSFNIEELLLILALVFIIAFSLGKYVTHSFASYTYLQGRPSSGPWAVLFISSLSLIILFYLKFPAIVLIFSGLLILFLSLFTSLMNYKHSKHQFYLSSFFFQVLIILIMIIMSFFSSSLYLIFAFYMLIPLITMGIIREKDLIEIEQ
ncbi:MAG: hypothetical protein ACXAC7_04695 [Candidatus Hodarchaeales archaeon]|jgi:hypothetical protein